MQQAISATLKWHEDFGQLDVMMSDAVTFEQTLSGTQDDCIDMYVYSRSFYRPSQPIG